MGWLDKFKALFNIEINAPLINITKSSNNKTDIDEEYSYDKDTGKLKVYRENLSEEKKNELDLIIKESVQEGNKFLEKESLNLLKDLCNFQKNKGNDKKVLGFFHEAITKEDLEALEAALYLRKKFLEKCDIRYLKQDIRTRFGDRGNHIANLCTAGYFENFFMPLYNSSRENFEKIYEVVVSKSAMAIFVNSQMNDIEIADKIKRKLEISKKYGLKFLHIHGIGELNIRTIRNCLEENKELFKFYDKDIFEKDSIIIVELIL
jgi:hypothetical protein